ncbi:MAG: hypothetical protein LAP39_08125 [Acidobacteriia bacterium]|nr:hypothetical protein [Terriglobia bacterium]
MFQNKSARFHLTCHIVAFAVIFALPVAGQEAASQIKAEIQRLQQSLKDRPISDPDFPDVNSMIEGELKAAAEALNAAWLYLSLEKLGGAADLLHGARVVADKKAETVKGGLPAYEAEWKKVSVSLNARDQEARGIDWSHAPAAIRALSETAQGKSQPLLEGGRGFATSTQPKDGLFYLGQAQGEAEFAQFCTSLHLPRKARPLPRRSLVPELQGLQDKTNAAFVPPRSIELHPRFIALNSTLKLAQELDAARFYSGALYQYLEAVRHYGMLDATAPDSTRQSALKDAVAGMRKKLDVSASDDSIAQIFVERAASQVAHADGSAPGTDEWKSAQVIIDQVLPAYFNAQKPASPLQRASGKTVDITLVRWPYT